MKCIIIDDEKLSRVSLEKLCSKVPDLELVATYESALEAIDSVKDNTNIDLIFLDIHMPELSGFT